MQPQYSPEFQKLLANVDAALIQAGNNALKLAEQTGTLFVIADRTVPEKSQTAGNELLRSLSIKVPVK